MRCPFCESKTTPVAHCAHEFCPACGCFVAPLPELQPEFNVGPIVQKFLAARKENEMSKSADVMDRAEEIRNQAVELEQIARRSIHDHEALDIPRVKEIIGNVRRACTHLETAMVTPEKRDTLAL